jgi:diguanylate cyclase (GGDEF)-like protein
MGFHFDVFTRERQVHDELTGLLKPAAFRLVVEHELRVARRYGREDALLVIGVEDLAAVVEQYSDSEAEQTLTAVARLLERVARDSDIIGRIAGDKFAIFALACAGDALANRISAAFETAAQHAAEATTHELSVGMSVVIAELRPGEEYDEVMTRAGAAIEK